MTTSKKPDGIYKPITTNEVLFKVCDIILRDIKHIGVDTETTGIDALNCSILGISIAYELNGKNYGYYIPVQRSTKQYVLWDDPNKFLPIETIRGFLNPILSEKTITKYLHNAKYDWHVLENHGFTLAEPIFDTMIGAWVLGNVDKASYKLKTLAKTKLNTRMLEFKEVTDKSNDFSSVSLEKAVEYAGPDGDITLRLARKEQEVLENYESLKPTFELETRCIKVLKDMEKIGALIDKDYLQNASKKLKKEIQELDNKISFFLNSKININSDVQLKKVLSEYFDERLENVSAFTLKKLAQKDEKINLILNHRRASKLESVYCSGVVNLLDENNRVHTDFYQALKTGRLSSSKPNLQNIPTRKDIDKLPQLRKEFESRLPLIRRAFIAKPGHKFVSIDYSQLELRVITHVSGEQYWIDAFNNGEDIHTSTASAVFNKKPEDITKFERKRAKFVNFGLLYGESPYGLSKRENMTVDEAEEFIATYFSVLPKVGEYINYQKRMVNTRGYTETFNGRRLYFKYNRYDRRAKSAAEREGINFPIQGGASDIVKTAMHQVHDLLKRYKTNLILQVHDELNFEMPEREMPILIPKIVNIMSNVFEFKVPLLVDVEYGDNWQDLEDWRN